MAVFYKRVNLSLRDVCRDFIAQLQDLDIAESDHCMWQYEFSSFDEREFFTAIRGTWRIAFRSRDCDLEFFGLGAADLIKTNNEEDHDALFEVVKKSRSLFDGQYYFGAIRFDKNIKMSKEWQSFGQRLFILPMILVGIKNGHMTLCINYRFDGHLSWSIWRDGCLSLLTAIADSKPRPKSSIDYRLGNIIPFKQEYLVNVEQALKELSNNFRHKKVVIGRRRSVVIKNSVDPIEFYFRLKQKSHNAFLFYLDDGSAQAFFGGSPELLFRRKHLDFETESLAGTRPRSIDAYDDFKFREALFKSFKDNREHILVSMHIEEKLKEFDVANIRASNLEIMALPYAQHLVKRYQGTISPLINDTKIISAFHPTPAVCGLDLDWALEFIRNHEGFDRGFYAGPIGWISNSGVEFAVAIRSALFHDKELFIYAACGIVPGSIPEQEWEELNNKEKNIMSIFSEENLYATE